LSHMLVCCDFRPICLFALTPDWYICNMSAMECIQHDKWVLK